MDQGKVRVVVDLRQAVVVGDAAAAGRAVNHAVPGDDVARVAGAADGRWALQTVIRAAVAIGCRINACANLHVETGEDRAGAVEVTFRW